MRISSVQRIISDSHHDQMGKEKSSKRAKRWFRRPAYSIRGDAIGNFKNGERAEERVS